MTACPAAFDGEHAWTTDVDVRYEHLRWEDRLHCEECHATSTSEDAAEMVEVSTEATGVAVHAILGAVESIVVAQRACRDAGDRPLADYLGGVVEQLRFAVGALP